jgi:hypothetical protein
MSTISRYAADGEENPVVILLEDGWHVAEDGRRATVAFCGKRLRERRAHSRLKTVGEIHVCAECLAAWREQNPAWG